MPVAAFGLKKYRGGTSPVSMTSNNVDSLARLGDSEVPAVKSTPCDRIPEFGQRRENDPEISSSVGIEQTLHVLDNNNSGLTFSNQSSKLMKESGSLAFEPGSLSHARKRHILAWEASGPNMGNRNSSIGHLLDILDPLNLRPVLLKNLLTERMYFTLEYGFEACPFKAEIESAYPGEE
jgi:hypothetical protein